MELVKIKNKQGKIIGDIMVDSYRVILTNNYAETEDDKKYFNEITDNIMSRSESEIKMLIDTLTKE